MKKLILRTITGLLLGIAVFAFGFGIWNVVWFRLSLGSAPEQLLHLERVGSTDLQVDPPGRSLFRPGGQIMIYLYQGGEPWRSEMRELTKGAARIQVHDRHNTLCMDGALSAGIGWSNGREGRRRFLCPESARSEFDVSGGGPYRINITVSEPFEELRGLEQKLVVTNFVCGHEAFLHRALFGISAVAACLALPGILALRKEKDANQAVAVHLASN